MFNSFEFLWMMPLLFVAYWAITSIKGEHCSWLSNATLLVISYGIYMKWNPSFALVLLWVTAVTYISALLISRHENNKKLWLLWGGVLFAVGPLLLFKYYDFVIAQFDVLLHHLGLTRGMPGLNWVLPIGISFYTLQAIGYVADVYHKRIEPEHNWWYYMLFCCFFPQIAAGPISRASDLLPQIKAKRTFDNARASHGMRWILWGLFIKVVVAERMGIYVDTVYKDFASQSGISLAIASVLYSFQIYGDFAGYSFMAIGVGKLMGFDLINNFNRPYLSQSITEFWRRWHISLSTWLRDYIYIPLGGNRCSRARNYLNIIITFFVSGIWHGANWTFIVWGLLHGLAQVIEKALGLNRIQSHGVVRTLRIIVTFFIVNAAWVFFRMQSLSDACQVMMRIITQPYGNIEYATPSMWLFILMGLGIIFIKDLMDEFSKPEHTLLNNKSIIVRWSTYLVLSTIILLCGVFDASQFIYVGF